MADRTDGQWAAEMMPSETHRRPEEAVEPPQSQWHREMPLLNPALWEGRPLPAREWALKDWIPARQATYLTGPGGAGKSLLAQQLCTCIALGLPFMGVETTQAVALYVTCEDDDDELLRRQKAICDAHGVNLSDLDGKLYLVSLAGRPGTELATFGPPVQGCAWDQPSSSMRESGLWWALRGSALELDVGFVALDNVAHLFPGNENDRHDVALFTSLLNKLALDIKGAVLFIGHPNKKGEAFSGSTAWENQVRSRLYLDIPAPLDPDARVLSLQKANYARSGAELAFRWHQGAFIRDEDLPAGDRAQARRAAQNRRDEEVFLACLDVRNGQGRAVSEKRAATFAPAVFAKMPETRGVSKARLEEAMERLFRSGEIERGPLWKDPSRHWAVGLKRVAANGAGDTSGERG